MTQDNFMYEWKKEKQHYDLLEDGSIHIHEDAPSHVKQSYKEYKEMMSKVTGFATQRVSFMDAISGKGFSSKVSKKRKEDPHQELVDEIREVVKEKKTSNKVKAILDNDTKKEIASTILNDLPDWFGIESCTQEYIEQSMNYPFWAYYKDNQPVGFIALKKNTSESSEIYVMGVLNAYHRQHIGSALLLTCESWCLDNDIKYLQVKTVSADSEDAEYAKTRAFYKASGFSELEVFPTLWDAHNPCLVMVKKIQ